MATVLTELDQFDATITVPSDGDTANAASISAAGVGFQPLANRTGFINTRINVLQSTVVCPVEYSYNGDAVSVNRFEKQAARDTITQTDITSAGIVVIPLPPLRAGTITGWSVTISPTPGHGGLPGTMPQVSLLKRERTATTSTSAVGATTVDPSASVGAYDSVHAITLGSLSEAVDPGFAYFLTFEGEAGVNSQTGLIVMAASVSVTQ